MKRVKTYFGALSLIFWLGNIIADSYKYDLDTTTCRLLNDKFTAANPWVTYPIVYDTIVVGRLNVWTGISSLPTSEFRCYKPKNSTDEIELAFASFVNRLEWTFYDMNRGLNYYGITVKSNEDVKYRVKLRNNQGKSYLNCNTIEKIEVLESDETGSSIKTSCLECGSATLSLINSQLDKLLKFKLGEQIIENLYWHISQLITNQHSSAPPSLGNFS